MKCTNCGREQESGKFCGKCGASFEQSNATVTTASPADEQAATVTHHEQANVQPAQPAQPNVHVENLKKKSKLYSSYFVQNLKNPSLIYNRGEAEFTNGLVSIVILAVVIGLSIFTYAKQSLFGQLSSLFGASSPSFFSVFGGFAIFTIAAMGLAVLTLFFVNKFFGPEQSFKSIVSLYGAHLSPVILAAAAALVLLVLKSLTIGNITLGIAFMFAVFILPLYLISILLSKKPSGLDPLYGFVIYIGVFTILFVIFITILADSAISGYLSKLAPFLKLL